MNASLAVDNTEKNKISANPVQEIQLNKLATIQSNKLSSKPPCGRVCELRDNAILSKFLADSGQHNITVLDLQPGEVFPVHKVPEKCLLVIMRGSGLLMGDYQQTLNQGSLLTIDKGTCYGIITRESSIHCLCIRFDNYHYRQILEGVSTTDIIEDLSYKNVLALNASRLDECKRSSYFTMLEDGTLDDPLKRRVYLKCVKKVSDYFQRILYARQATCSDKKFFSIFLQHFKDEFQHNEVLFENDDRDTTVKDPQFDAILTWFCFKMFDLDNIGKAVVVNLVFESAGDYMCNFVRDKGIYHACPDYFHVHAEVDEDHTNMATELLYNQHPEVYREVLNLTNEAWDMFMAMFDRMVAIVNQVGVSDNG